jgi:hypothetical protein
MGQYAFSIGQVFRQPLISNRHQMSSNERCGVCVGLSEVREAQVPKVLTDNPPQHCGNGKVLALGRDRLQRPPEEPARCGPQVLWTHFNRACHLNMMPRNAGRRTPLMVLSND